jgi:hypothetical protein
MPNYVIKKKSRLWKILPGGRNKFSATLGETIYLSPDRYDDYHSKKPKKSTIALIEHEKVHVDQYRRDPGFKRRYVTSRKWRLRYEAEAYARQVFTRVQLGSCRDADYYVDRYAKLLSSKAYLLFMSYDSVYQAIDDEYEKLERILS